MEQLFIKAAFGEFVDRPPIWIMRQAGRYIPEYNEIKANQGNNFWTLLKNPKLVQQITLLPTKYITVDALILFSDILVFLPLLGLDIKFNPGPKLEKSALEVGINNLNRPNISQELDFVYEAIKLIKQSTNKPLIGFGGAPYTIMCYCLAEKNNKNNEAPRKLYYQDKPKFEELHKILIDCTISYLQSQIDAGVDAIKLFDTWVGTLDKQLFELIIIPAINQIFDALPSKIPKIYFTNPATHLLESLNKIHAQVIAVDWRTDLLLAKKLLPNKVIAGNLDPAVLFSTESDIKAQTLKIIDLFKDDRKLIFNLGSGIYPDTPLKNVQFLTNLITNYNYTN